MGHTTEWMLIKPMCRAKSVPIGSFTAQRQTPARHWLQFLHSVPNMSLPSSRGTKSLPLVELAMIQKTACPTSREIAFLSTKRFITRLAGNKALRQSQISLERTLVAVLARLCWSSLATRRLLLCLQARPVGHGEMSGAFCKIHDTQFFFFLLPFIKHLFANKMFVVIAKLSLSTTPETAPRKTQQTHMEPRYARSTPRTLDTASRLFSSTMLEVTSPLRTYLVRTSCLV